MKQLSLLLMAGTLAFFSCKKDNSDVPTVKKLVKCYVTTTAEGIDSTVSTYDASNVLTSTDKYTKMSTPGFVHNSSYDFGYKNGNLVTITEYAWATGTKKNDNKDSISYGANNKPEKRFNFSPDLNGKFVLNSGYHLTTYNTSNQPVKYSYSADAGSYQTWDYDGNGNISTVKVYYNNALIETDTYLYDSKTNPLQGNNYFFGELEYFTTNNSTQYSYGTGTDNSTYTYDADGYPTKITSVWGTLASDTETIKIYY